MNTKSRHVLKAKQVNNTISRILLLLHLHKRGLSSEFCECYVLSYAEFEIALNIVCFIHVIISEYYGILKCTYVVHVSRP